MSSNAVLSRNSPPEHPHLAPPRQGRWLGPVALALVAHGLLVAALTWGVGWKQDAPPMVFEAELWSRLPVQAAPRAEETPALPTPPKPQPKPQPTPESKPEPKSAPTPKAKAEPRPAPPPPGPSQAQIATERAKKKKADEQLQRERDNKEAARQQAVADKRAAEKRAAEEKAADQKRVDKKAADQATAAEKKADAKLQAQQRADREERDNHIRRMLSQAGASGGPTASGTAQQSSAPSPAYGGRVAARIKPNVVFTETIVGNPRAEVEVRTLPDGTITSRRIVKSSGNADWDEAVLKAIDRTASLPRDTDGRVPASLIIGLRPLD